MSDAIEGDIAAYGRTPAWHRKGKNYGRTMTLEEAKRVLGGWRMRVEKFTVNADSANNPLAVDGNQIVTRTNPTTGEREVLGIVGSRFNLLDNETALDYTDSIVEGMSGNFDAVGSLHGGTQIFAGILLDPIVLDPKGRADRVDQYLSMLNGHDGSATLTIYTGAIRPECANMIAMGIKAANSVYRMKHTKNMQERMDMTRKVIRGANVYFTKFQREAEAMIQTEITNQQFDQIVKAFDEQPVPNVVDGKTKNKSAVTRWENRRDLYHDLYRGTGDVLFTNANITGTAWGAYQTLIEYIDWHRQTRGNNDNLITAQIDGTSLNTKREAREAVRAVVGV